MAEASSSVYKRVRVAGLVALSLYASAYRRVLNLLGREQRYLFVLGHQRSGSTLLTHILGSSPEILGYGETHTTFNSPSDLDRLLADQFRFWRRLSVSRKYVLDKLVNDHLVFDNSLFELPNVYTLFTIREPVSAVSSLIRSAPAWTHDQAVGHYICRLQNLQNYAAKMKSKRRAYFLTHDQLVDHTEVVLQDLRCWLELQSPLRETYDTHKATGVWGIGDGSSVIKAGRIVREGRGETVTVSPELQVVADDAYAECVRILTEVCQTPKLPVAERTG